MSSRKIAERLGLQLTDIDEFSCCGYPIKAVSRDAQEILAFRNLALASARNMDICTLCNACTVILQEAAHILSTEPDSLAETLEEIKKLGLGVNPNIKVRHLGRILYEEIGLEKIRSSVTRDISSLTIAVHYGCHYLKPKSVFAGFDDPENPRTIDELVEAAGAKTVSYTDKTACCGGSLLAVDEKLAFSISREKLLHIKSQGADAIVLMCPFCSVMYDDNQKKIETVFEEVYDMPVLYYPQALGLAMGFDPIELGLNMNRVKTKALVERTLK